MYSIIAVTCCNVFLNKISLESRCVSIADFTKHTRLIRTQTRQFSFLLQFMLFMQARSHLCAKRNQTKLATICCTFSFVTSWLFCASSSCPEMILVARIILTYLQILCRVSNRSSGIFVRIYISFTVAI
jgi:hypothetical protein